MIKLSNMNGEDVRITSFKFSGGEVNVKIEDTTRRMITETMYIDADIDSSDAVMELLLVTDALRRVRPAVSLDLYLPYLPYARQDRAMVAGESLSLKVFATLINAQNYSKVYVQDAHSDVGPALLDRCINVPQYELVPSFGDLKGYAPANKTILVSPDAGAEKKIFAFAKQLEYKYILRASKVRDVSTGKITNTEVTWATSDYSTDRDFLIVDDICDGGGTFIALAEILRKHTTGKIKLLVTHGIFSKGIGVFDGIIDEVFVINNMGKAVSTAATKVTEV